MNKEPMVSVIVPIYNVEKYLKRCIDSILNQTYKNLEIILVDDGSPDNCPEICDEYAKSDKRIKVIHKQNAGVSAARNDGIAFANGDLIGFVDPDDYINSSMYEEMVNYLVSENCDLVSCSFTKFSTEDEINNNLDMNLFPKEILTRNEAISLSFDKKNKGGIINVVWTLLIRTEIAKSVKFDCSLTNGEDTKYSFDVLMKANRVGLMYAPFYYYYKNENGAVANADLKKLAKFRINFSYKIYLSVCAMKDKALKKEAYLSFINNFSYNIFLVNKSDLKKFRGLIFKNIFGILRSPNIYWKEKILIILKLL